MKRIDTDPNQTNHHIRPIIKFTHQNNRMDIRCCPLSHLMPCNTNLLCCFSGFFRSDALIGTATVKLQPLETACEIHDSFDVSSTKWWGFQRTSAIISLFVCAADGRSQVGRRKNRSENSHPESHIAETSDQRSRKVVDAFVRCGIDRSERLLQFHLSHKIPFHS